jgi:predicted  nucleic acid-binding Zn-ribbon protein
MATAPGPARTTVTRTEDTEQELLDVEAEVELIQRAQERQLSRFKGLNASLVKKLRKAEAEAAALLTENKVLEQKNADLVEELRRAQLNSVELAKKEQELADTQVNLSSAQKDLIESQLFAKKLRADLDTLESEKAVLEQQHGELKETSAVAHRGLTDKRAEYDALHNEKTSLTSNLTTLKDEHEMLKNESMERSSQISALEAEKEALGADLAENNTRLAAVSAEVATLTAEKAELDKSLGELRESHAIANNSLEQVTGEKHALESRHRDLTSELEMSRANTAAKEAALVQAKTDADTLQLTHQEQLKDQLGHRDAEWSSRHKALRNDIDSVLVKHATPETASTYELPAPPTYSSLVGSAPAHGTASLPSGVVSSSAISNARALDPSEIGATRDQYAMPSGEHILPAGAFERMSGPDRKRNSVVEEEVVEEMVVDPREGDDVLEEVDDEVQLSQEEAAKKRQGFLEQSGPSVGDTSGTHGSIPRPEAGRELDESARVQAEAGNTVGPHYGVGATTDPRDDVVHSPEPHAEDRAEAVNRELGTVEKAGNVSATSPIGAGTPATHSVIKKSDGTETGVTPAHTPVTKAPGDTAELPSTGTKKPAGAAMSRIRDLFKSCCAPASPAGGH